MSTGDRERNSGRVELIEAAIRDYHYALDCREHGDKASDALVRRVQEVMGMRWEQGVEKSAREGSDG